MYQILKEKHLKVFIFVYLILKDNSSYYNTNLKCNTVEDYSYMSANCNRILDVYKTAANCKGYMLTN